MQEKLEISKADCVRIETQQSEQNFGHEREIETLQQQISVSFSLLPFADSVSGKVMQSVVSVSPFSIWLSTE